MSSNKEDEKSPVEVLKGQDEGEGLKKTEALQSEKNKEKFLSQSSSGADAEPRSKTSAAAEDEKTRRDGPYEPGVPERLASTVVSEAKEQVKDQQFDHKLSPEDALEKAGETKAEGDAHLSTQAEQQREGVGEVLHAQLPLNQKNKKTKKKKITSAATTQSLESSPASPLGMMSPQEAHKAFKIPEPVPTAATATKKSPEPTMTVAEERKWLEESLDSVPKNAQSPSVATKLPQHTMPPSQVVLNQTERRHMDEEMETSQVVQDPETAASSDTQIVYYSYSTSTKDLKTSPTPIPVERHVARTPAASNSASAKALNRAILAEASGTPRAEDERYRGIDEEMEMERKQVMMRSDQQQVYPGASKDLQTKRNQEELASLDEEVEKSTIRMPGAEKDDDESPSLIGIPLQNHEPTQRRPPSSSASSSKGSRSQGGGGSADEEEMEMERKQVMMRSDQQQAYPGASKDLQTKRNQEELASLDEEVEKSTIRMPGAEKDDDESPSLIGIPLQNHEPTQQSSPTHPPASVLPPIRLQPPGAPFPPSSSSSEESPKSLLGPAPSIESSSNPSASSLPTNRDPGYLGFVARPQETLKQAAEGSNQQLKADLNAGNETIKRTVLGGSSSSADDLTFLEKSKLFVEESAKDVSRLVSRPAESISATETLKDSIQEGINQVSKAVAVAVHAAQSQLDVDSLNGTPDQLVEALSGVPSSSHLQQQAKTEEEEEEAPLVHKPSASVVQKKIATTTTQVASDFASKAIPVAQQVAATAQDVARVATPVVVQAAETTLTAAQDLAVKAAPVVQTTMESAADLAVRTVPVVQRAVVQTASTAQDAVQQAASVAQDVASKAGPVASQVLHDAKESLQTASEYGKEMAGDVSNQLAEAQSKVSTVTHQAMDKAKDQAMQANAKVADVASKTANHVQEAKEMTSFVASETADRVKTASAAVATKAEMSVLHAQDAVVGTAIQAGVLASDLAQRSQDVAASMVSKAQDKLHSVQSTTSSIGQSVEDTATGAVLGVKGAVESARNTAANVLESSKESMEARKESLSSAVQNAMEMSKEMLHATAESAKETVQSAENLAGFATAIAKSKAEGVADSLKDTKDKTVAHLVEAEQFSGLVGQQVVDAVSLQLDETESSLHSAKAAIVGAGHSVVDRATASLLPGSSSSNSTGGGGGDSNTSSTPALVAAMMQGASTVVDMASSSTTPTITTNNTKPETTKLATESWMNSAWEGIPLGPKPSMEPSGGEMSSIEIQAERVWNANKDKLRGFKSMPDPTTTTGTEEEVAEKPWGSQLTDFSEFDVAGSSMNRSEPDQVGQDLIDLVDKARSRLSRHFRSSASSTKEAKSTAATDSMFNPVPPRAMPPSQLHPQQYQQQQGIATSAVRSVTIQSLEESKDVLVSTLSSSPSLTADSASYDSSQTFPQDHQHPEGSSSIMRSAWNRAKRLIPFIDRNSTSAGSVSVPSVDEAQGNEIGGLRKEAILGSENALTPSDAPQGYATKTEKRLVEIHTGSGRTPDKDMDVIPQGNEIGGIDQEQILRHIPKKVVLGEGEQKRPLHQKRSKL